MVIVILLSFIVSAFNYTTAKINYWRGKSLVILLLLTSVLCPAQIKIVFLGHVDNSSYINKRLKHEITFYYGTKTTSSNRTIPDGTYYSKARRYRAEKLLAKVAGKNRKDRILAIIQQDISATGNGRYDWGVMGLTSGNTCVVSLYRLKTTDRLIKVAIHEIGHMYGLGHCPTPGCYMHAYVDLAEIDSEYQLCARCKNILTKP